MADGVVFDIELLDSERVCKVFRADEGRESGMLTISRFTIYRQEICITPHTFWSVLY